jgi:hypothetical protein
VARGFGAGLYRVARTVRPVEQVSRGRGLRRARNIAIGRSLARTGAFRRLWGGSRKR